ncbi:MFS transporter [Carboxylicivirga mesophila]|uniref:MFS transporter n=1 Tax=Carboxylicivirga mesophila TaxID=1166478 RepID=A0ABS5KA37_9BACT|nr:MFS transporter [Carboxylicivirga mesophila]MBS2211840.1 MFS transporter [Carboxylicivirga mesophila]
MKFYAKSLPLRAMNLFGKLNQQEARTFRLHLFYSSIDGIASGALILNEFIFIKSLKGSNVQLAFLFQFSMVVFLFAMVANELMRRFSNRKRFLRITGIITRLPLVGFAFFPSITGEQGLPEIYHLIFLAVFLLFHTSKIAVVPSINQYLKGNYRHQLFGKLFGYATTVNKIAVLVSTFVVGELLHLNANSYKVFYPVVGVLGVVSVYQLTKIEFIQKGERITKPMWYAVGDSFKRILCIVRQNVPFRHLEIGFMLYGFAWMSTHAVVTIFYKEALDVNYPTVALYNIIFNLIAILLLPLFGKLIGSRDPRRFAILTFGSLMLFIVFTALTEYFPYYFEVGYYKIYYLFLVALFFNGVFTGSMPILWGIGSSYFCKPHEAADYQSVHLFLTGLRALFAPIIGIQLYEWLGFSFTYGVGVLLLVIAIVLMVFSEKHFRNSN